MSRRFLSSKFALLILIVLGLGLRIYQLGVDSFWIDEVGVALAAQSPSPGEALRISHNHVMAMPLDYVVAWLFARFSTSEFWLRLPSSFWGSLALVAAYLLFRRLSGQAAGLAAALLLALSPLHVQYSQELRFYAALVFFYLLSTWLLKRAVERPEVKNWVLFSLFTLLGIFFHVYVLLALANGIAWVWLADRPKAALRARLYFIRSCIFILTGFIVGLLAFGSVSGYDIPLLLHEKSLWEVVGKGLGWLPFFPPVAPIAYLGGALCMALAVIGILHTVIRGPRSPEAVLIPSLLAQMTAIIMLNAIKHYFLAPRQFLFLLPFTLFYTALGIFAVAGWLKAKFGGRLSTTGWPAAWLLGLCVLAAIPALLDYYAADKGQAREISRLLAATWQPGDSILVVPDFDAVALDYYFSREFNAHPVREGLVPADWESLNQIELRPGRQFLVLPFPNQEEMKYLENQAALQAVYLPERASLYSHAVWLYRETDTAGKGLGLSPGGN